MSRKNWSLLAVASLRSSVVRVSADTATTSSTSPGIGSKLGWLYMACRGNLEWFDRK